MNTFGPFAFTTANGTNYVTMVYVDPAAIARWLAQNAINNGKSTAKALGGGNPRGDQQNMSRYVRLIRPQHIYCGSFYLGTLPEGAVGVVVRSHPENILEVKFLDSKDCPNQPVVCVNAMDVFDTQEQST